MTGLVSPTSGSWTNGTAGFDLRNEMIRYVRSCPLRGFILISTFCRSLSEPHEFRQPSLGARMSLWRVRFYIITSMIWRSSRDGKQFVSRFCSSTNWHLNMMVMTPSLVQSLFSVWFEALWDIPCSRSVRAHLSLFISLFISPSKC